MWLFFAFASAFFLGIYDVSKKIGLTNNAVLPVLFLNTLFCSLIFVPLILLSHFAPQAMEGSILYVPQVDWHTHLYFLLKSVIVLSSWGFSYVAVKHLPITLVGPLKSLQPALTLFGGLLIFGENLNFWQFSGVTVALVCFFLYALAGRKEGISFWSNRWVWFLFLGVFTGSASGLFDKYLLGRFDRMAVQCWYLFYQVLMMTPILLIFWYPKRKMGTPFKFRWSIIGISFFLCLSDFLYFYALSQPDSMISVISVIRRSGIVITFAAGALLFKDKNIKIKALILLGVLLGMYLLYLGSV